MKMKKTISLLSLSILTLFFTVTSVYGADFRIADENNGNVYVDQGEQIKNLYTAGNLVSIDANIQKGLHAGGNVVTINGNVGGTVYSGAATLFINGVIGGSVHGGGGSVIINNKIADDLFIGGGNISISRSASIGDDLFIGGGTIDIQGPVSGDAYIGGGVVVINSEIKGNVKVAEADTLKLGASAKINGNLEYSSKEDIKIEEGAVVLGEITILNNRVPTNTESTKGTLLSIIFLIVSLGILVKIGGLILIGLVLIYLFRNVTQKVVQESLGNFWKSLGMGLVTLIIVPITGIILLVTLIGMWLGFIVGLLYVLSIMLAISVTSIIFGSWLTKMFKKDNHYSINWKIVVGGVIALALVKLIPVLGGLVCLVIFFISLGGIYQVAFKIRKS